MISSAQTLPPKPAMPPAAAAPPASPSGGPSFAQFLTEQTAPPPTPAEGNGEDVAASADATDDEGGLQARNRLAARRAAGQPRPSAAPQPAPDAAAKAAPPVTDKADKPPVANARTDATDEQDAEETPELKEFTQLIGLTPAPAPVAAANTTALARPDAAATAVAAGTEDPSRAKADKRAPLVADAGRAIEPGDSKRTTAEPRADAAKPAPRTATSQAQAAAAETRQAATDTVATATPPRQDAAPPSFAAALAQAMPAPVVRADAPPATLATATLQSPLHSPAFAPELGARVSLLAVDGVQRAELQLNPAEMGPVTVQIVVDGNQAQVSFQALQAETRQALEQSLPDLAAALQGQGLTLSGGGVSQQSARDADHGQRGEAGGARADARGGEAGPVSDAVAAAPQRRSVGLLDTFA